ncbi:hypothetical protein [uncultured Sphingopyxis sp.]|uniref:hypothetical protein n=1 Tax=uncultured Sphingopyxis sp. TaxID=310581 RepID=UPI0025981350|nr:hypothetical protein [uncultured Sphingopyxis sp.]
MTTVDTEFAAWLASDELTAIAKDAVSDARWGTLAIDTEISSPLAFAGDAAAEAARQLLFRPGPLVIDTLRVPGFQVGVIGEVITLRADKGGYAAGVNVFVLGADEREGDGGTKVTVLRRL